MTDIEPLSVYYAGALFSAKDLLGNLLIADAIARLSNGRYKCVLPQDVETTDFRSVSIRNHDLLHVMTADLCIFNFDGTELDSGTVVEFMFAKMLGIPCVILRTDFRASGDQQDGGEPWNLMCSAWPNCHSVIVHGMAAYHEQCRGQPSLSEGIKHYCDHVATKAIEALDQVRALPPLYQGDEALSVYRLARKIPGSGFETLISLAEVEALVRSKSASKVL